MICQSYQFGDFCPSSSEFSSHIWEGEEKFQLKQLCVFVPNPGLFGSWSWIKKGDFAKWVSVMVQVCASTAPVWIMQQTQCSGWWGHWMIEAECGIVWKCVEKCGKVWNSAANVDIGRHSVRLFIKWLTTTSNVWQTYHWPHNLANVFKSFLSFPTWILCVQCWLYNVLCLEASHVVSQLWMRHRKMHQSQMQRPSSCEWPCQGQG